MIGIDTTLMTEGMCADYNEVYLVTHQIYDIVKQARTIHVTSAKGSDVTATFHSEWKWVPSVCTIEVDGRVIMRDGQFML